LLNYTTEQRTGKNVVLRHLSQTIGHLTQRNRPETGLSVLDEMRLRADVCSAKQWYDTLGREDIEERGRGGKKMTVKRHAPALIVATPGRFRDSLRALLVAAPHIEAVDQADDAPSALKVVAARHPALVLLDTSLPGNQVWTALRQIKAERPETRCIILADNTRWQQEGSNSGADAVLLKGFPTAELFQTVERLLQ
jgi:CheY-like chemotaxis protein